MENLRKNSIVLNAELNESKKITKNEVKYKSCVKPFRMDKTSSLQNKIMNTNGKYSPRKTVLMKAKCYVTSKISKTLQGSCYNGI